jgi:hypothetical protein
VTLSPNDALRREPLLYGLAYGESRHGVTPGRESLRRKARYDNGVSQRGYHRNMDLAEKKIAILVDNLYQETLLSKTDTNLTARVANASFADPELEF